MASYLDPKLILQRKLADDWSSPEFAHLLETKTSLLSEILPIFRGLEQQIKLRLLLAFLAIEEISILPKDGVLAILDDAASDPDEWVKVISGLVREWLYGSDARSRSQQAYVEVANDVLNKCGLIGGKNHNNNVVLSTSSENVVPEPVDNQTLDDAAADDDMEKESSSSTKKTAARVVDPEPYFCPIEYLYLSESIIQRHHHAAPLTRRENVHFKVGDLSEVKVGPPIPELSTFLMPPPLPTAPPSVSLVPQPPPSTTIGISTPTSSTAAATTSAAVSGLASTSTSTSRPRPAQPSSSSILSRAALTNQRKKMEKPRLKIIGLDELSSKQAAKTAAINEAISQEMNLQPLKSSAKEQEEEKEAKEREKETEQQQQHKTPKERSAAEALAGLLDVTKGAAVPPPAPASSSSALLPPPASTTMIPAASAAAAGAGGSSSSTTTPSSVSSTAVLNPLTDYHRMKARSNRLTPQDDERIRLFYLQGAEGNPNPEEKTVKIKIHEEEETREDGSKIREMLYITLNYDSKKAVLSRKVSKPKTTAATDTTVVVASGTG